MLFVNYLRCSEVRYSNGIEDQAETLEEQDKEDPHERQRAVPPGRVDKERDQGRNEGEPQRVGGGEREREREREGGGGGGGDDNHQ